MFDELRLIAVLILMFTLPGWAMLAIKDSWRQWSALQRWCIAISASIAFYPVLFYVARFALPFLTLGPYKLGALLIACSAFIAWRMRTEWRETFAFEQTEWIAIALFGMTLFTRFWIIRDHPYPAWSDSLHHTLLTQLTATQGQLPINMEPYFPIPLGQYHLGLYSLSTIVQWLARVPAHTALLWTAQALNGLCGLSVYLALDRKVGRTGAIVGTATVGLLSHQPAFHVNWGRFTQLSSQTIVLVAWVVTYEAIKSWKQPWTEHRAQIVWNTGMATLLNSAVFLLHFRVAGFYAPLLIISVAWEMWKAREEKRVRYVALGTTILGVCSLAIISPVLWDALRIYVSTRLTPIQISFDEIVNTTESFYEFSWQMVLIVAARSWLISLTVLSSIIALLRRNKTAIMMLLWTAALLCLGQAYLLRISLIAFTNMGAVLAILYLPISLVVGIAAEESLTITPSRWRDLARRAIVALVLIASFAASHIRVTEIIPFRHLITSADITAMDWINKNTPSDATFAVNTYFWLPLAPHGTDAGYWIPYFTGRQTTAGAMILNLADWNYKELVIKMSQAEERLETDNTAVEDLRNFGVDYVYIGKKGDFSGPGLDAARIAQAEGVSVVYQHNSVHILKID